MSGPITYDAMMQGYTFTFNTTEVISLTNILGTYLLHVYFEKKYYERQEAIISVTVMPMESVLEVSETSVDIYYNETCIFMFNYIDIARSEQITGASGTYEIIYNNSIIEMGKILFDANDRYYYLIFNSTDLINESRPWLGIYMIHVAFSKQFYEDEEKYLSVNVMARETILELSETSVSIEYEDTHCIHVMYLDAMTYEPIKYADSSYSIYHGDILVRTGILYFSEYNNSYYLIFDTLEIINESWPYLGTYTISITIHKTLYRAKERFASITVTKISTIILVSPESLTIEYGEYVFFRIHYLFGNGSTVLSANVSYVVLRDDEVIFSGAAYFDALSGAYIINISSCNIVGEDMVEEWVVFTLRIYAEKYYCIMREAVLSTTITKIACMVDISEEDIKAEWGQEIRLKAYVYRNKTLEPIYNATIDVSGLPEGSWRCLDGYPYIVVIDTAQLEIIDFRNSSYIVDLRIFKEYHSIPTI